MIAALGMLRALERRAKAEAARYTLQARAMANAIALLEAKRPLLKEKKPRTGHISAQGLKRIRAAQKARWDAFHKQQAQLAKKEKS